MSNKKVGFWSWYFCGNDVSRSGLAEDFLSVSTLICFILAIVLACFASTTNTSELAKIMVQSMIGIFIGVSFTGSAFALTLISSDEIQELIDNSEENNIEKYIFGIQSASLLLLLSIFILTVIAADFFPNSFQYATIFYLFLIFFVFFRGLLECWELINFSIELIYLKIMYKNIKK